MKKTVSLHAIWLYRPISIRILLSSFYEGNLDFQFYVY